MEWKGDRKLVAFPYRVVLLHPDGAEDVVDPVHLPWLVDPDDLSGQSIGKLVKDEAKLRVRQSSSSGSTLAQHREARVKLLGVKMV